MKATVAIEEKAIGAQVKSAVPRCTSLGVKAPFRARAIPTPGVSVYRASQRKHWLAKLEGGAGVRAECLLSQLDVLSELRPKAKAAMIAPARRQPDWKVLRATPQQVVDGALGIVSPTIDGGSEDERT